MNLQIQLFGAFRDFDDSGVLTINVEDKTKVSEVKSEILKNLKTQKTSNSVDIEQLLKFSVIATEQNLLSEDDIINFESLGETKRLAILPPVCGG